MMVMVVQIPPHAELPFVTLSDDKFSCVDYSVSGNELRRVQQPESSRMRLERYKQSAIL